jgi:MtN3 and saliva related transmembrane protein
MDLSFIGFIAAFCTTISFLPQVIKAWKTRQTKDISLPTYMIMIIGIILWFAYGIYLKNTIIILANGTAFVLTASILYVKLKNG